MTDYRLNAEPGTYEVKGKDVKAEVQYPWKGKPWAAAADAANNGLNGQGYIVHSMMLAGRVGTRLTIAIIGLMVLQIAVAVWGALR